MSTTPSLGDPNVEARRLDRLIDRELEAGKRIAGTALDNIKANISGKHIEGSADYGLAQLTQIATLVGMTTAVYGELLKSNPRTMDLAQRIAREASQSVQVRLGNRREPAIVRPNEGEVRRVGREKL